jgi:hypothetical protein
VLFKVRCHVRSKVGPITYIPSNGHPDPTSQHRLIIARCNNNTAKQIVKQTSHATIPGKGVLLWDGTTYDCCDLPLHRYFFFLAIKHSIGRPLHLAKQSLTSHGEFFEESQAPKIGPVPCAAVTTLG